MRPQARGPSTIPAPSADASGSRRWILGVDSDPNHGYIVELPHLRELRNSGQLTVTPIFDSLSELDHDHLIWCTGFRPAFGPFPTSFAAANSR